MIRRPPRSTLFPYPPLSRPRGRRVLRPAVAGRLVQAAPHEPLARAARVHRERDLLVVLGDREPARVLADAARRVRAPRRGEQADHRPAVEPLDRAVVALPPALEAVLPRLLDALVAHPLLDERDQ